MSSQRNYTALKQTFDRRVDALKEGIGEKLGMIIFSISTFSFSLLLVCKHAWSVSIPFFGIIVAWAINVSVFCGYQVRDA